MLKGPYWLILGLCVWFLPYVIIQFILTPMNPDKSTSELLFSPPAWLILIQLGIAVTLVLMAVRVIRKERKESKNSKYKK